MVFRDITNHRKGIACKGSETLLITVIRLVLAQNKYR